MHMINKEYNCKELYENPSQYMDFLYEDGYLIYKFRNLINNKCYIGDTFSNLYERLFRTWGGHFGNYENNTSTHLYNSMRKYGLDKFVLSIIYKGDYDYDLEGKFIEKFDSYHNGYNNSPNGKGVNSGYTAGTLWINNGEHELQYPSNKPILAGYRVGRLNFHPRLNCTLFYNKNGQEIVVPNNQVDKFIIDNPDCTKGRLTPWVNDTCWVTNGSCDRRISNDFVEQFLKENPDFYYGMAVGHTAGMVPMYIKDTNSFTLVLESDIDTFIKLHPGSYRKSPNEGRVHITNGSININLYPDEVIEYLKCHSDFRYGHSYGPTSGKRWVNNGLVRKYINNDELAEFLTNNPDFHLGFALNSNLND